MDKQQFLYWELASRDTIDFKKVYVDMADDLIGGLLLSQIVYWHLPNKETGESRLKVSKDGYDWLAKGRDEWFEEIRITAKQFDRAIRILENKDLVEVRTMKFNSNPTKHIRLKWNHFLAFLEHQTEQNAIKNRLEPYSALVFTQRGKTNFPKGEIRNAPLGNIDIDERSISTITEITNIDYNIDYQSKMHQGVINLSHKVLGNKLTMDRLKSIIHFYGLYEEDLEPVAWKSILTKLKTQLDKRIIKDFDGYLAKIIKQEIEDSLKSAPRGQISSKAPVRTEYTPEWFEEPEIHYTKLEEENKKHIDDLEVKKREIEKMLKEIDK